MKDVCAVFVYVYAFEFLAMKISSCVCAFVYHQGVFSCLFGLVGEHCSIEAGANDEEVVFWIIH